MIINTFVASNPYKGYFTVTPIVTDTLNTYIAVSYNDNADSQLDSFSRYLQTIRIFDYYEGKYITDINGWYPANNIEC